MKITLHIGVEKTGSTSIQSYLTRNRDDLLKQGILYAQSLSLPNNDYLVAFSQDPGKKSDIRAKYGIPDSTEEIGKFRDKITSDLKREIGKYNPSHLIISNEHLTSRLHCKEELDRLFGFLLGFSDDIELIVYLRRQDSLLESLYSTAIISGNTYEFDTYFNNMQNRHDLYFYKLLKMWESFIPKDKIKIRVFENKSLRNRDIVDDFLHQVEVERSDNETIEANTSLGCKKTEFLRRFNLMLPLADKDSSHLRGNILQLLYKAPLADEKIRMSDQQREEIVTAFSEENKKTANYFLSKSELFYLDKSELGVEPCSFTTDDMMEIFAFVWKNEQAQIAAPARENQLFQAEIASKEQS